MTSSIAARWDAPFTNAAAVEAHLLDAHREGVSNCHGTLGQLLAWHDSAHAEGRSRFPHIHCAGEYDDDGEGKRILTHAAPCPVHDHPSPPPRFTIDPGGLSQVAQCKALGAQLAGES